jgi:uncharacterized protein (DUF924 family)
LPERAGQRNIFATRNIAYIGKALPDFYRSFSFLPFQSVRLADQQASVAEASRPATATLKFSRRENLADIGKALPAFYPSFSFLPFQSMRLADQPASFAKASRPAIPTLKFSRRENLGVDSRNRKSFL